MSLSVLHHAPVGAIALDERSRIADANAASEAMMGLSKRALLGCPLAKVFTPVGEETDELASVGSGARIEAVAVRTLAEGPMAGQRYRMTAWRADGAALVLLETVGAHEDAAANLTELAAIVAHEIRNPLAGIGTALEVIADRLPAGGAEREVIAEIRGRLDGLNEQVEDLLLLVRPVPISKSPCELRALIAEASRLAEVAVSQDPGSLSVDVDPALMTKALARLLRYSKGTSPLSLSWTARDDRLSIRLFGGRLTTIRGEAAKRWSIHGRHDGLELPVARRIAEAHQGRLEADVSSVGVALRLELRPRAGVTG